MIIYRYFSFSFRVGVKIFRLLFTVELFYVIAGLCHGFFVNLDVLKVISLPYKDAGSYNRVFILVTLFV